MKIFYDGLISKILIFLFRFLERGKDKGKIDIELTKTSFTLGEKIEGKVILELKKPQKAKELKVYVFGMKGSGKNSRSVYYNEQILEKQKEYPANQRIEYPFQLQCATSEELVAFPGAVGKSGFWGTIGSALNEMTANMPIHWELWATLEVPGSNVDNSVVIKVS